MPIRQAAAIKGSQLFFWQRSVIVPQSPPPRPGGADTGGPVSGMGIRPLFFNLYKGY